MNVNVNVGVRVTVSTRVSVSVNVGLWDQQGRARSECDVNVNVGVRFTVSARVSVSVNVCRGSFKCGVFGTDSRRCVEVDVARTQNDFRSS